MSHKENITRIKVVHNALGELADRFFFVGGATVSLYTDRMAEEVRPTDDVDILIELTGRVNYAELEEQLRSKSFQNDIASGVICRYKINGVTVDVMPTSETILGFTNQWYAEAVQNGMHVNLDESTVIRIFDPVYFLASKIEAFKGRGGNDGRWSTDFEDIIYLLNNRSRIWLELRESSESIRGYLRDEISALLANKYLDEWISCHLEYAEQSRVTFIMRSLSEFIASTDH
jgi:hypothetical protein